MATLEAALAQAQAGNGQVVGVVAEAGTGKSRLCYEFVARCRAQGMRVNEGRAVAHGKNIPYLPMLEVFRAYYGIADQDDDHTVREKIAGRLLLLDDSFRDVLPVQFEFFGVPDPERPVPAMDPDAKQRQLFAVLRRIVQGDPRAAAQQFATVIEDLHWLDPGSEAFLDQWVAAIAGSSAFLLVNFRPEYHADWMQKSYYRQLPLAPLGPDDIRDLLADLLGDDPSTRGLAEAIHARTGGNPFFTEEVVQALIESGHLEGARGAYCLVTPIERLDVPASVHAVLAARIDRLPEREKRVLQAAAVIGKEFAEPILLAAAELPADELRAALATLRTGEFVYEQVLYPVAEYAFKHPLTQEVALGSQLQERRRRTHAAVARVIERAHADKLDEQAALLARHWEGAEEPLVAAHWHRRAAEWVRRNDPVQGMRHMQRVLALTDALEAPGQRDELRLEACGNVLGVGGWRVGLSWAEMEALLADGIALAASFGDVGRTVAIHSGYANTLGFTGDIRGYHDAARKAVALVDDSVSRGAAAAALVGMDYSSRCLGRFADALEFAEQLTHLTEGDPAVGIETLGFSAWGQSAHARAESCATLGRLDEARTLVREALQLTRSHDMRDPLIWALTTSVVITDWSGYTGPGHDADEARRHALEALGIAEQSGSHFMRVWAYRALGMAHLLHGDGSEAAEVLEEALAVARTEQNGLEREADLLAHLARAYLGQGDAARAHRGRAVRRVRPEAGSALLRVHG